MKKNEVILINCEHFLTRVVLLRDKRIEQLFVELLEENSCVGNIYLGKVVNVLKGIDAAFVDIGTERNGFLPFEQPDETYVVESIEEEKQEEKFASYQTNQELIVQVVKPPSALKGAKLTTKISLPGKFLVLMPFSCRRTVSRRIEDTDERKRLIQIFNQLIPADYGYIIRTAAAGKTAEQIKRDVRFLLDTYNSIKKRVSRCRPPCLLWKELDLPTSVLRDYVTENTTQIIVDEEHTYKKLRQYLRSFTPEVLPSLNLYRSRVPVFVHFGVEEQMHSFLQSRVGLPSGGYLLFDESETLNSIDINTGSSMRANLEETIFHTNMEAAREIPRQIVVRNLSGLIVIDFIDMRSEAHRRKIFQILDKALEEDKARTKILHISRLGLVEMSREKVGLSLRQTLLDKCPHCGGSGRINSIAWTALQLKNELMSKIGGHPRDKFKVALSETLAKFLRQNRVLELNFLERKRIDFQIVKDSSSDYFSITQRT